jgi:hypothetical protein
MERKYFKIKYNKIYYKNLPIHKEYQNFIKSFKNSFPSMTQNNLLFECEINSKKCFFSNDSEYLTFLQNISKFPKFIKLSYKLKNDNLKIHNGIQCKKCGLLPIIGNRFKCSECLDYNLCEKCENEFGESHSHNFIKLRNCNSINLITNKMNFICLNKNFKFNTINNNNIFSIYVDLLNNGNISWSNPFYFSCLENESEICGKFIKILKDIKINEKIQIKITLDLKNIKKNGVYKSVWCLKDDKNKIFGEKIIFYINCIFENEKINEDIKRIKQIKQIKKSTKKNKINYITLLNEMKKEYNILLPQNDYKIYNALMNTHGNKKLAFENLCTEKKFSNIKK